MYLKVPDDWALHADVKGSVAELLHNSPFVEIVTDFSDIDDNATATPDQVNRAAIIAYLLRAGFNLRTSSAEELLMLSAWVEVGSKGREQV